MRVVLDGGHFVSTSSLCWYIPDDLRLDITVGELRSGVTGFATIYATGSHRLVVEAYAENLRHKNKYSNLANKRGIIYKFSISMNLLVTGISDS